MNLKDFAINMDEVSINFRQIKNASEVATKAALSSTMLIAEQVGKKLHIKSDGVEIVVEDSMAMVISKDITMVADIETFIKMDYDIVDCPLHVVTDLLQSLVNLGVKFQKGSAEVDTEFTSKGLTLSSAFLKIFHKVSLRKNVSYQGHNISIDGGVINMDGAILLKDGIYYYYEWATRVLIDLMGMISVKEENKYDVLFGGKPFSNDEGDIKEWPCKHA